MNAVSDQLEPSRASRPVTVVVVTFNSAAVVADLLRDLPDAMSGVASWDLIVADNASTDGTLDVVERVAPYATVLPVGHNAGYAAGFNAALRKAPDSDAVLLLNPDLRPRPGFTTALLRGLGDDVGIVVPQLRDVDGQIAHSLRREPTVLRAFGEALLGGWRAGHYPALGEVIRDNQFYSRPARVDWASGAAQLINRRCLEDVGEWDESYFLYSEETDFALRARDAGWATEYRPDAVAVHVGGEAPTSPRLWSLLTRNRVRLHRRRHGALRSAAFWMASVLNAGLRAPRSRTHRAGLRALLGDPPSVAPRRARRVLIIVQNLPVPQDRRVWREAQALVTAGFQVSVISPKADGDAAYQHVDGVDLHKYTPPPETHGIAAYVYEFAYCWLATAWLTLRVLRRTGIDALQACNPPDTYFALAALLKPFGVTFVFDHHDLCPEVYRARFGRDDGLLLRGLYMLERATFAVADHVISTNESYMRIALERGDLTPRDVTIVRNGPDLTKMRRGDPVPELREGRRYLCVYLGVMGPQDGVDTALHAMREVVHRFGCDVHLALLGDGDCFSELVALADGLDISEHVTFTGWANDGAIRDYLSTADIGVGPDAKNAFNDVSSMNKIVEYMAYGLPIVSFDLKETRISAADAAVYVDDGGSMALASAIVDLLSDPSRRRHMGSVGRARIENGLAWSNQKSAYLSVFDRVLSDDAAIDASRQAKATLDDSDRTP